MTKPNQTQQPKRPEPPSAELRAFIEQAKADRANVEHLAIRVEEILSRESELVRRVDDAKAMLHRGMSEVTSALKQASAILENARTAAALEERMNETDEANKAMFKQLGDSLGKARDQLTYLNECYNTLRGDMDSATGQLRDVQLETGSNSRMLSSSHPLTGAQRAGGVVTVE